MNCVRPIRKIQPNPYESPAGASFIVIGPKSPLSYRKAIRDMAADFANHAHYSPAPYDANEAEYNPSYLRDRVLLFSNSHGPDKIRCFGAVGFRWQKYDDVPGPGWFMMWAWFHPSEQRKGHLTNAWPHLLKSFPGFIPIFPWSPAMIEFMKKFPESLEAISKSLRKSVPDLLVMAARHNSA